MDTFAEAAVLKRLRTLFPLLSRCQHALHSEPTDQYNCIAFVFGDDENCWWPYPAEDEAMGLSLWPRGAPLQETVSAFQKAFELQGFRPCETGALEVGLEKIVLYCKPPNEPTHAAKQITDGPHAGQWLSKLGEDVDIRHETPEALESPLYGKVSAYFSRARSRTGKKAGATAS